MALSIISPLAVGVLYVSVGWEIDASIQQASLLLSLVAAALVAAYVWFASAKARASLFLCLLAGAALLGSAGFLAGFLGAVYLEPGSPQAPLWAFFITGPLGTLAGLLAGALWWAMRPAPRQGASMPPPRG
jgi:hypothetical protein